MSESKNQKRNTSNPSTSNRGLSVSICAGTAVITFALLSGLGLIIMGSALVLLLLGLGIYLFSRIIGGNMKRRLELRTQLFKEIAFSHVLLIDLKEAEKKARNAFTTLHHLTRISDSRTLLLASSFIEGIEFRESMLNDYATSRSLRALEEGAIFAAAPIQLKSDCHSTIVFEDTGVKEVPRSVLPVFAENITRELSLISARRTAASRAA